MRRWQNRWNEPDFGAREKEMGIVFAAFKPPTTQAENSAGKARFSDKRRMNGRFRNRSA
jgi:hypothetical protein